MTILDEIIAFKYKEVEQRKKITSLKDIERGLYFERTCFSLSEHLLDKNKTGIIAEFKRKSPSKGTINDKVSVEQVTKGYASAGASALSVLTDESYFGGSTEDFLTARKVNDCPMLRKDFMVDEYQVYEAKAMGADVILLIAASLEYSQAKHLGQKARELGMEVLMEVHTEEELDLVDEYVNVVGVNNRNLKTFEVDIQTSIRLAEKMPEGTIKISESGITDSETILLLKKHGFQGFLIGEAFMRTPQPEASFAEFVKKIK